MSGELTAMPLESAVLPVSLWDLHCSALLSWAGVNEFVLIQLFRR